MLNYKILETQLIKFVLQRLKLMKKNLVVVEKKKIFKSIITEDYLRDYLLKNNFLRQSITQTFNLKKKLYLCTKQ